jgi:hypothetical protein
MIADAVRHREVSFSVVNLDPDPVVVGLERMGVNRERVSVVDGDACVNRFVDQYRDRLARDVTDQLRGWRGSPGDL